MIKASNIIKQLRIDCKDINMEKYSDWDIENAMNKALRMIANHFSRLDTDFLEKSTLMLDKPMAEGMALPYRIALGERLHGDQLPIDYLAVSQVLNAHDLYEMSPATTTIRRGKYIVYRGWIFATVPILLRYHRTLPNYSKNDVVDIPLTFFDFVVVATEMVLKDEPVDVIQQYITKAALEQIPSRRYANAKQRMPWRV